MESSKIASSSQPPKIVGSKDHTNSRRHTNKTQRFLVLLPANLLINSLLVQLLAVSGGFCPMADAPERPKDSESLEIEVAGSVGFGVS